VEEIALLNTVLVRWDGARLYCPNSRLSTDQLTNLSRSGKKGEVLKVGGRHGGSRGGWQAGISRWSGGAGASLHLQFQ